MIQLLISSITVITSLTTALIALVVKLKEFKSLIRPLKTIIGVVGETPEPLRQYPDFSDFKKALMSQDRVVILHCRTLSYSLRNCDFVCAEADCDPKIRKPTDNFWLNFS